MDQNAKQQVVERLKGANNVLVTVSTNPSVDQLAGAIGLTLMINEMGKHATAVFSGKIPDTMQFLDPTKTLENTVDSLRDFIIALDKNKADKLRYKVQDDVVKIFITPYRTRISEADLQFSQGDYNVDVVIALGVHKKDDLDKVIVENGRILHDAAVISVNIGVNPGDMGSINWTDNTASSLSEMLMSISEALQSGLVNEQVATALLTGIVAETERFSNEKTTPKVMTMAAQLMAAGANQQLIASHLHPTIEGASAVSPDQKPPKPTDPSEMEIKHSETPEPETPKEEVPVLAEKEAVAEIKLNPEPAPTPTPAPTKLPSELPPGPIADMIHDTKAFTAPKGDAVEKPAIGGTFNATATEAHDAELSAREHGINTTLLNHDGGSTGAEQKAPDVPAPVPTPVSVDPAVPAPGSVPLFGPSTSSSPFSSSPASKPADDFSAPLQSLAPEPPSPSAAFGELNPAVQAQQLDSQTLSSIDASARDNQPEPAKADADTLGSIDLDSARKAVEEAMGSVDFSADNNPVQATGTAGELIVQPETEIAPSSPPSFAAEPPDVPPPFLAGTPTPEPIGSPMIEHHDSGYVSSAPASETPKAEPAPNDFTLPPMQ